MVSARASASGRRLASLDRLRGAGRRKFTAGFDFPVRANEFLATARDGATFMVPFKVKLTGRNVSLNSD